MATVLNGTLSRSAISAKAIAALRQDIIMRRYPPDSCITEQHICDTYGISRSPARAIMQQLEKEGMLRMLDNGYKQIITFTKKDMNDLYELRNYIELSAVEAICRAKTRSYAPLVRSLEELETLKQQPDADYVDADIDFHRSVIAMGQNRILLSAYDNISPILYTIFTISVFTYEEQFLREFDERHNRLVRSLISEDEDVCLSRFREHHDYALQRAILTMDEIEAGRLGGVDH